MSKSFLRIHEYDSAGRLRITITKQAYEALGAPQQIRIQISKKDGMYKIRLSPTDKSGEGTRHIRILGSSVRVGGAAYLIKNHNMKMGYYFLTENNIFIWRGTAK